MLPRTYDTQNCSVARALEVVGDRWTLLVIRSAFEGVRRFDDFQTTLGVARNVLTDRLARLCAEGIMRRVRYQERPQRFEYRLTRKGVGLWPAVMSLLLWGDQYYADDGPPLNVVHRGCNGALTTRLTCATCGASLGPTDIDALPGAGTAAADTNAAQPVGR